MQRQTIVRTLLTGAVTAALFAGTASAEPPAADTTAPEAAQAGAAQTPMQNVTDEQLAQFVDAASNVRDVQATYAERVQNADDQEQAITLRDEAQQKMVGAVEDSGLTVQEFNLIAQRLQADPDLAERFKQISGS